MIHSNTRRRKVFTLYGVWFECALKFTGNETNTTGTVNTHMCLCLYTYDKCVKSNTLFSVHLFSKFRQFLRKIRLTKPLASHMSKTKCEQEQEAKPMDLNIKI